MAERRNSHKGHVAEGGFTILEALLAMGVLIIGILAVMSSIAFTSRLSTMERETSLAMETVEEKLAQIRSTAFADLYTTYGPGGTQSVDVPGLTGLGGGSAGSIHLIANETLAHAKLGLPRDLNGDGDATDSDVSDSYVMLPVILTVEWTGPTGPRRMQLHSLIAER